MNSKLVLGYNLYIIALLFCSLSMFFQLLPLNTTTYFQTTLHLEVKQVINLTSLYFVTYAIMQIPSGMLLDKYGERYVLPISILVTTLGCILYWCSFNSCVLGLSRLLTGIGCSVSYIIGIYIAIKFLPPRWLLLFIGITESSTTSGTIVAAKPFKTMLNSFGWYATGSIVTGFCLLLLFWSLIFVKKIECNTRSEITLWKLFKSSLCLLKNKTLLAIFIYSFATWLVAMSFPGYWLKPYLIYVHKYSESQSLGMIQIYWESFMITSIFISLAARSLLLSKFIVLVLSLIGVVAYGIMSVPLVFDDLSTALVFIFGGISATGIIISFSIIPELVPPELSGVVVAMNNTFVVLGGFCGQIIFGYLLGNINIANILKNYDFGNLETHYYTAMLICPLFTLIGFIAVVYAIINIDNKASVSLNTALLTN